MRIVRTHEDVSAGLAGLVVLDARLEAIVARAGPVPLRRSEPGFPGLAAIIVAQMISRASAAAIWGRMTAQLGTVTAQTMLSASDEDCRAFGLSRAKTAVLRAAAAATVTGAIDLEAVCAMDGPAAIRELSALNGIGRWTAEVYLVFCAGHPDVFPVGDVALQTAVGEALALEVRPSARELGELATIWAPWRSVAARLFWAYYATVLRRGAAPAVP